QRYHRARRLGDVHYAVSHDGRAFQIRERPLQLVYPCDFQARNILTINLLERRILLRRITAAVGQPILRFILRVQKALVGNALRKRARRVPGQSEEKKNIFGGPHWAPFNLARYATRSLICASDNLYLKLGITLLPGSFFNSRRSAFRKEWKFPFASLRTMWKESSAARVPSNACPSLVTTCTYRQSSWPPLSKKICAWGKSDPGYSKVVCRSFRPRNLPTVV